jgi:hypothetical protein
MSNDCQLPRTLSACFVAATLSGMAQAASVDVVPYMSLKPGQWAVVQRDGVPTQDGYATTKGKNGQVVQTWYYNEGSGWAFDSSLVFLVSATELSLLEENDGTARWRYEPPVVIPRPVNVGQPVFYAGRVKNLSTNATSARTLVFLVTAKGLAADAPVGSFVDCIKNRMYTYGDGRSRDSVSLHCRDRHAVKGWHTKIKDGTDPQFEEMDQSGPNLMTQSGDSNPPFP